MSFLNRLLHPPPPSHPQLHPHAPGHIASSLGLGSFRDAFAFLSSSYVGSSLKLFILGFIVETGRRLFRWLIERFAIKYCTTIRFIQGDPAYEWIVLFLNQEKVYRRSREFTVSAANSQRKWSVAVPSPSLFPSPFPFPPSALPSVSTPAKQNPTAEFVPLYTQPQLFRWRGHWVEIKRTGAGGGSGAGDGGGYAYGPGGGGRYGGIGGSISVTVYTLDMTVLSDLVEDARLRYLEVNRPNVVIHLTDSPQFGPHQTWASVKHKIRRPLSSIILPEGVVDALVKDAQEFLSTENWYNEAGIPHRRGYLLYGPPGTGKTSTIYALAGALNLEIYSLSLASNFVDDSYLQRAASAIPKHGLFLIEDIDCAFPSREDEEEAELEVHQDGMMARRRGRGGGPGIRSRSMVTLSGLLNVIDGIGSEEGKLFFATTNHIDRLDAALLRPGRIDHKVQYGLATEAQAHALFMRFFPPRRFPDAELAVAAEKFNAAQNQIRTTTTRDSTSPSDEKQKHTSTIDMSAASGDSKPSPTIAALADAFAAAVPVGEFSTAELQGFLQGYKSRPHQAAAGVSTWAAGVRREREERVKREAERRARAAERRRAAAGQGVVVNVNGQGGAQGMGMGMGMGQGGMPGMPPGARMFGTPGLGMPGTPGAGMPLPMPMHIPMPGFPMPPMGGAQMQMPQMPPSLMSPPAAPASPNGRQGFPMPPMGTQVQMPPSLISPPAALTSPNGRQAAPTPGMAPPSQTVVVVPTAETIVSGVPGLGNGGDANYESWEQTMLEAMVNGAPRKVGERGGAGEAAE
ncbi:hypothetical protein R3P38DRAFT_3254170 [Favolaschia claudopus]|uniref:P-loop containing nucleoside triphosphate hydrolase protein n=1 Tax=Favolaschia claudopus TaxID=2862362 RepID=A0AAW0DNH0_9AGAR